MTQKVTHLENNVTPTTMAINELTAYLQCIGHTDAIITLKDDMLYVEFPKKVDFSEEKLEAVGNIFYWTKTLAVPYISGLVHFYEYTDSLLISVRFYDKIFKVHEYLISKKINLLEFDVCVHEFSFKYECSDSENINEINEEILEEIKTIVDPENEYRRTVFLDKFESIDNCYTLSVKG